MTAIELKEYIIQNNKVEFILESLGCHKIKNNHNEIRCALPNHNNGNSVSIKLDTLKIVSYDDTVTLNGDIFAFIMKLKNITFPESIKWLHNLLDLKLTSFSKDVSSNEENEKLSSIFLKAKATAMATDYKKEEMNIFNSLESEEFLFLPHIKWINDGIFPSVMKRFNIGYDLKTRRIIIPHRLWCGQPDDYVGLIGRTTIDNFELLDIPKYKSMREERYPKTMNIYGLQENYQYIQEKREVVVFEAEKSVLKRCTYNDNTGVAICGHSISQEQARILISLDVDIIIAMDRGIDRYQVRELCENFYNIRRVFYMWDTYDAVLKNKDSPADLPHNLYNHLYKFKFLYDDKEHHEYIKEKAEREKL